MAGHIERGVVRAGLAGRAGAVRNAPCDHERPPEAIRRPARRGVAFLCPEGDA